MYLAKIPWTRTRRWSGSSFTLTMPLGDPTFPWVVLIVWALALWCFPVLFMPAKVSGLALKPKRAMIQRKTITDYLSISRQPSHNFAQCKNSCIQKAG